ncbi:MAG: hypothetical protein JSR44_12870 [Spirochaetes bacterium]|nr:hypothetical protein [Spirochaetota bacterium]
MVLLLLALTPLAAANVSPSFIVTENFSAIDIAEIMQFCGERTVAPTLNEALCHNDTNDKAAAKKARLYKNPVWSFLTLANGTDRAQQLVLEHKFAITERVTVEDLSEPKSAMKIAGDTVSMATRDYKAALPAFRLALKAHETKIWRISIASDIVTQPGFFLYSEKAYFEAVQDSNIVQALFYGLMLSMVFYNALLYFRLRLTLYLYYLGFIISIAIVYLGLFGQGFAFIWPDAFLFQKYGPDIFKFTAFLSGVAFFTDLMQVRERLPKLARLARYSYPLICVSAVAAFIISPTVFFVTINIFVFAFVVYGFAIAILSLAGYLPFSAYYCMALLLLLCGITANLFTAAGVLPVTILSIYSVQIGTAFETIFLSLALGERFAALREDNQRLQLRLIAEKKRIARDIHDVVGTELQMRLLEIGAETDTAVGKRLTEGLRSTLNKVREFLFLLHTEEHLAAHLEETITSHLKRLENTKQFLVEKTIHLAPESLATSDAYQLERAIEEIISNIARHARANRIRFHLACNAHKGFLAVVDNGIGFDKAIATQNIGFESLRYRAERLGGRLRI